MHTELCRHAAGSPEEYARVARDKNLAGVYVTCHNPLPDGIGQRIRMYERDFPEYLNLVRRASERLAPEGIEVRLGLEADFLPGLEPYLHKQLSSAPFDYVLGSVHWHLPEWRELFWDGTQRSFVRSYFEQLAEAAESELFDCLSHPDLIKNSEPEQWDLRIYQQIVEDALDRIAATGVAMELNTSGRLKAHAEFNPGVVMLELMFERGIPVVVGADAHSPSRVGDGFPEAMDLLWSVGYREVHLFEGRQPRALPLADVRASLAQPETASISS